jgi:hypothetical protein
VPARAQRAEPCSLKSTMLGINRVSCRDATMMRSTWSSTSRMGTHSRVRILPFAGRRPAYVANQSEYPTSLQGSHHGFKSWRCRLLSLFWTRRKGEMATGRDARCLNEHAKLDVHFLLLSRFRSETTTEMKKTAMTKPSCQSITSQRGRFVTMTCLVLSLRLCRRVSY